MSEIVAYQSASLTERMKYAQTLAHAGDLIPVGLRENGRDSPPSPGKILLVMETGAMLGLNPMAALQGIDVIEGKATISPQLMTGLVRARGHKIEIASAGSVLQGTYMVKVTLTRSDDGTVYESIWDPHRAARAGLCSYTQERDGTWKVVAQSKYGKTLPWQSYPETMCKWRAVGDVCREGADDVLKGISYTREEVESAVSITEDPEPVATEDWEAQFDAAQTVEEVNEVSSRIAAKGEGTDALRVKRAARLGLIESESNIEDAEEVTDGGYASEQPADAGAAESAPSAVGSGDQSV